MQQLNNTHFSLSQAPEKTIVEWINSHREMLQQSFHLTSNMGNTPYCLDEIRIEQSCDDEVDWFELHITVVIGNLRIPFHASANISWRKRENICYPITA